MTAVYEIRVRGHLDDHWSGWLGDLLIVPDAPHSVTALEDAVILLTVAKLR